MADSLKEFYNSTAITYSDLKSGVTIETNSSTEEAMLKDLTVESLVPVKFKVNNFDILEVDSKSLQKYEGNEIIPASSSLIAYTDAEAIWNVAIGVQSGTTYWETIFEPEFSNPLVSPISISRDLKTFGTALSSSGQQSWYIDGKFYHTTQQGNRLGTNTLYVRNGLDGADSVALTGITDGSTLWDGERYFVQISSSSTSWNFYDTQTSTVIPFTSTVQMPYVAASTAQWDCHNGVLFFARTVNNQSCSVIDYRDITNIEQSYITLNSAQATYTGYNYIWLNVMRNYKTGGFTVYIPMELGAYDSVIAYEIDEIGQEAVNYGNRSTVWSNMAQYAQAFIGNKIYLGKGKNQVALHTTNHVGESIPTNFVMSSAGVSGLNAHVYGTINNGYTSSLKITMASIDSITDAQFGTAKIKASGVKTTG
jgi:hypothetical protein